MTDLDRLTYALVASRFPGIEVEPNSYEYTVAGDDVMTVLKALSTLDQAKDYPYTVVSWLKRIMGESNDR